MPCRIITSPATKKEETSVLWNELFALSRDEKKADEQYKAVSSEEFISKYGNWIEGQSKVTTNRIGEPALGIVKEYLKSLENKINEHTKQAEVWDKLLKEREATTRNPSYTEQKPVGPDNRRYLHEGTPVARTVTEMVKKKAGYKFKDKEVPENSRSIWDQQREFGSLGHKDMEHILSTEVDENGFRREEPLKDDYSANMPLSVYQGLQEYIRDTLSQFPKGTRFLVEQVGYDPETDTAGTQDFVALYPGGETASILDWKFKAINKEKYDDIPWFDKEEWNDQMNRYRRMLKRYGIQKFDKTRMVPIIMEYNIQYKGKDNPVVSVKDAQLNSKLTIDNKLYELPVPTLNERTGVDYIDRLLDKLTALYKRESAKPASEGRKDIKAEVLNSILLSIREIQVRRNLQPVAHQADLINRSAQRVLNQYDQDIKNKDLSNMEPRELGDFLFSLQESMDNLSIYASLDTELRDFFKHTLSEEDKKIKESIAVASSEARNMLADLKQLDIELAKTLAFQKRGIGKKNANGEWVSSIMDAEKQVDWLNRNLGLLSTSPLSSMQALYSISQELNNNADDEFRQAQEEMFSLHDGLKEWSRRTGKKLEDGFSLFRKEDNTQIDEIDQAFFHTLKEKIKSGDKAWIRQNIDEGAYRKKVEGFLQEETVRIEQTIFAGTDEQQAIKKKAALEALDRYKGDLAVLQYGSGRFPGVKDFVIKEKWYSKEFQELRKNPEVLAFYHYINKQNTQAAESGYLDAVRSKRTFLAFVKKDYSEMLASQGITGVIDRVIKEFSFSADDVGYGQRDDITGKVINKVPRYFTKNNGGDYTDDLFKAYTLFNRMSIHFKYATQLEQEALLYQRAEEMKKQLQFDNQGHLVKEDDGTPKTLEGNQINRQAYNDALQYVIYGKKYIDEETDVSLANLGTVQKFIRQSAGKINRILGKGTVPEDVFEQRTLSTRKVIDFANRSFRLVKLGLNPLVSAVNFLGSNAQVLINSKEWYSKADFLKHELQYKLRQFQGTEGQKILAVVHEFMPLLEDETLHHSRQKLSPSFLQRYSFSDALMSLQSGGDKLVQYASAAAMLENAIIRDGAIVNSRKWLKQQPEFLKIYDPGTPESERRRLRKELDQRVEDLKKENVFALAEIKDDKLSAPWLQDRKAIYAYRGLVQNFSKILVGGISKEDIRRINQSAFGASFMVFKSWIPRMTGARFNSLDKIQGLDDYEWGRVRMAAKVIFREGLFSLNSLKNTISFLAGQHSILKGTDKGLALMDQLFEQEKEAYYKRTGKELEMTREAFFSLVEKNMKAQFRETIGMLVLMGLFIAAKAVPPDPDEDKGVKNFYKYSLRGFDKLTDELSFYYSGLSFQQILNGSVFPSLGIVTDLTRLTEAIAKEGFGYITQNDKLVEDTHVIKYAMKTFPVSSQMLDFIAMFYPDAAQSLGIQVSSQSRLK